MVGRGFLDTYSIFAGLAENYFHVADDTSGIASGR
jgi:hypothetical protein